MANEEQEEREKKPPALTRGMSEALGNISISCMQLRHSIFFNNPVDFFKSFILFKRAREAPYLCSKTATDKDSGKEIKGSKTGESG